MNSIDRFLTAFGARKSYALSVLWLLIIATFCQVVAADYVGFDEQQEILANPSISAPLTLDSLIHIFTSFEANQYTPLSIASHWLEYNLSGFNSAVSHFVNLILHLLAATAVFFLAESLFASVIGGFFVAAFWAVHPLQVDTVSWVLERRNILFGMFFFASMMSYAHFLERRSRLHIALATVFMLLSGLAKTLAFALPFFWLLIDWMKARPLSGALIKEKIPGLLLSVLLVFLLFAGAWAGIPQGTERFLKWNNSFYAMSFYVAKTILPLGLSPTYEENSSTLGIFDAGPLYLLLVLAAGVMISWRRRIVAAGVVFYLCNIFPVSGLVRVGYPFYVSCHFMYVALFGLILALGFWLHETASRFADSKKLMGAAILLLLCFSYISFNHSRIWLNTVSLFEHSIKIDPQGKFSRNQLAGAYFRAGKLAEAEIHFTELIKRHPGFYSGFNGRGMIYSGRGENDKAMEMFNMALACDSKEPVALRNRGMLRFSIGQFAGAEEDFSASLEVEAGNLKTHFLRAELRARQGQYARAIEDLHVVMQGSPGNLAPRIRLGELLLESAEYYSALDAFLPIAEMMSKDASNWQAYLNTVFYPSPVDFMRRIGPFRNWLRYRIGWYPF